jgi:hypothetical protein
MNRIATECACRLTEDALHKGIDHLIILTSAMDSDAVRRAVGTVMPHGSTSTGAIWTSPTGDRVSVKRYGDHRPAYQHRVSMNICNGGRVISKQEAQDVERWYEGGSKVVPFMGA